MTASAALLASLETIAHETTLMADILDDAEGLPASERREAKRRVLKIRGTHPGVVYVAGGGEAGGTEELTPALARAKPRKNHRFGCRGDSFRYRARYQLLGCHFACFGRECKVDNLLRFSVEGDVTSTPSFR
jgi:hypothetical protein